MSKLTNEQVFDLDYAFKYEKMWSPGLRMYEAYTMIQSAVARDLGFDSAGKTILDLGTGTGNSAILEASHFPDLDQIIGIDPNPMIKLLALKLLHIRQRSNKDEPTKLDTYLSSQSPEINEAVENMITLLRKNRNWQKIKPVFGAGERLPLKTNSVDQIHIVQALHWMGRAPDDQRGDNLDYLQIALKEMRRVLKKGSLLLFDESAFHFRFVEEETNRLHIFNHPFYLACEEELIKLHEEKKLGSPILSHQQEPRKINRYDAMFNLERIEASLAAAGFELIIQTSPPIELLKNGLELELGDGKKYLTYFLPHSLSEVEEAFTTGGLMTYFDKFYFTNLSLNIKKDLLAQAVKLAKKYHPETYQEKPFFQITATFAAVAL